MIVSIYFNFIQAGKLKLRSHILAKSNELRSLEALVSKIQDPRVEVRVEVVAKSGRPSLVFTKKEKAALTNGVPFDDVRLVVDANGNYHLFVFHFDLVRSGTIDLTSDQLRSAVREVIEDHPCPGVNKEIVDKQDYVSSELEEKTLPWRRFTARNCARVMKRASITRTGEEKFKEKCRACHKVEQKLLERIKVKESLTEEHVKSRQSVSSKVRLSCLSPKSKSKRLNNVLDTRKAVIKQMRRYRKKFSVLLSGTHSSELDMLMERVESTPMGKRNLRNVWRMLIVSNQEQGNC